MLAVLLNIGVFFIRPLNFGAVFAIALLLFRLWRLRLIAAYWTVCGFFVAGRVAALLVLFDPRWAIEYYEGGEILKLVFATFAFWDLSRRVLGHYPSLAEFARRSAKYILPLCFLLGVLSYATDPSVPAGRSPRLHLVIAVQRAVTSGLLAYLLILGGFAGWFPVRMRRNAARVLMGLLAVFGVGWITALVNNAAPGAAWWADTLEVLTALIVCACWLKTLDAAGEQETASTVPQWNPARMADLTRQLDQMQAQLSRRGF